MDPNSLDGPDSGFDTMSQDTQVENLEVVEARPLEGPASGAPENPKRPFLTKRRKRLLLVPLIILLIMAGGTIAVLKIRKPPSSTPTNVVINTQSLDNGTLNQVTDQANGQVKQQLTISPSTIFKSDVTVQGSVEITKGLLVNGAVNIQNAANIRDTLSVGKNLTVGGLITAGSLSVGSITISSINVSGDLVFGGHIIPGGGTPSARASVAAAGGSVSISGNDTAGTITITTGTGGLIAGELAIVNFQKAFGGTPKVQLTPLNIQASALNYFATHTSGFFTVNTGNTPAGKTTYIFDYLVTQ